MRTVLKSPRECAAEVPVDPDADMREARRIIVSLRNRHGSSFSPLEKQQIEAFLQIRKRRGK